MAFKTYFSISSLILTNFLFLLLISHSSYKNIFPYSKYYPNQEDIIEFISSRTRAGNNPVFESPTGSGKTVAVLSIPLAREQDKKIIYLCRTHEQMDRVIEELKMISANTNVLGISMRSRKDLCPNEFILENTHSNAEGRFACSILKREGKCAYYKNLERKTVLKFKGPLNSGEIARACGADSVCPYEFLKSLLPDSEVIACSYLYIFEPGIRSSFLKAINHSMDELIIVLDEAHNLPRLAGNIAGKKLSGFAIERALGEIEDFKVKPGRDFLEKLQKFMILYDSDERRIDRNVFLNYLGGDIKGLRSLFCMPAPHLSVTAEIVRVRNLPCFL
jgi:DNA excision repair protein ERCC-2